MMTSAVKITAVKFHYLVEKFFTLLEKNSSIPIHSI